MDDSPLISRWTPEDQGDAQVDRLLKAWFQQVVAEPTPAHLLELIDRLDATSGM